MKLLLVVACFTAIFINVVISDDDDDFDLCDDDDNRSRYWWACSGGHWGRGGGGGGGGGGGSVWGILGSGGGGGGGGGEREGPENSGGGGFRGGSFGGSVGSASGGAGGAGNFGRFSGNFFGGNIARGHFQGGSRVGGGGHFFNRNGGSSRGGGQFWRNGFFSRGGRQLWNRGGGSRFFNRGHNSFGGGLNRFNGRGNFGGRFNPGFNRWYRPQRPIYNFHRNIQNRNFIFPSQTHIHYRPFYPRGHHGGGHFSRWRQNSGGFHLNNGRYWQRPWYNTGGFRGSRNFNTGFHSRFNRGMSNFFPYRGGGSHFSGNFRNFGRSRFTSSHGRFRYRHVPKVIMRPPQYYPGIWRKSGGGSGGHSRWTRKAPY